MLKDYVFT